MNRTMTSAATLMVAAIMATASGAAQAASCATMSLAPPTPAIPTWDPINPAEQSATFTLTLTRASSSTKRLRVILLDGNSSAPVLRIGTSTGPRYRIENSDNGALVSFPQGTQIATQTVPLTQFAATGNSDTVTINLRVSVLANLSPIEDFVGGTNYSEPLGIAVQCFKSNGADNGTDTQLAGGPTLSLRIPKLASIVTAAPVNIDFGNFSMARQQAMISVKSTSSLNVSVATANGSRMLLGGSGANPSPNMVIPYSITFNHALVTAGTPLINQSRAGVAGSAFPLELALTEGNAAGKLAGNYSDTITLSIEPGI